ncbi:MAG TPA: sulfite exporter TauE/SafE family protein [Dehalococcoidia bacterium]|nr:sulfite exporter TauE/SafE family protein [Dehalococcoidia bacterium]
MPDYLVWPGLLLLGLAVGAYGTMIGAGGGFILVPVLLLLYPSAKPELVTSISLAVVFANALSGTVAYVRQNRVDFVAANAFALATVPGAIAGALVVGLLPRDLFDAIFGVVLLLAACLIFLRPAARIVAPRDRRGQIVREHVDRVGDRYVYSYSLMQGLLLSLLVGFVSSMLGLGGGIIHVPLMVLLLHFPEHVATATSHYVLTITALVGTIVHIINGDLDGGWQRAGVLAVGVIMGAQVGARLSGRVPGRLLLQLLAVALVIVGARLLISAALDY